MNIAYLEGKDTFSLTDWLRIRLAAQYTDQRSEGENLLLAHPFSAHQFGFKAELAFQGALLTVAYTGTGNGGTAVQSPWSANPGYTTEQVASFDRAAYNFPMIKNLSAYALYVHGSSPNVQGQYAQQEYDFNLQWKAMSGSLRGLTLLARYGHVSEAGPEELHTNQWRLALYYDPPWLSAH
jgi:hypothetical protein